MKIIPYVEHNGMRSIPDLEMIRLYNRMKELGLVDIVFYSNDISTPERFLQVMKNPRNIVNVVVEDKNIVAISWLNDFYFNSAFAHFCMFPEIWGTRTVECGKKIIQYWFDAKQDGEYVLDVIIGKIPTINKIAVEFIRKVGFKVLGDIPYVAHGEDKSKRVGDTIAYITRS